MICVANPRHWDKDVVAERNLGERDKKILI